LVLIIIKKSFANDSRLPVFGHERVEYALNDVMILSYDAKLGRMEFSEGTGFMSEFWRTNSMACRRDQDGKDQTQQRDHCALTFGDSLPQSIRIGFLVHTGADPGFYFSGSLFLNASD
jgi:hypothetical protein